MSVEATVEKKPYTITEYAGWFVAGRKVPSKRDEDGNLVPLVGHVVHLTEAEAKYELLSRSIQPVETAAAAAPAVEDKPEADAGSARRKRD